MHMRAARLSACACRVAISRQNQASSSAGAAWPPSPNSSLPDRPMIDAAERFRRLRRAVGGLLTALAPHMLHLQAWVIGFVLTVCVWRLLAERRNWPLPGAVLRMTIA